MDKRLPPNKISKAFLEVLVILITLFVIGFSASVQASDDASISRETYNLIIDEITCRENINTKCSFITKKYYQNIGEAVDPDEIADAKLRLGTLLQFKNIRIILEKAEQRGHVVVVFIVQEAEHIQYDFSLAYQGNRASNSDRDTFGITTGVTDYNFLGSGKQLSLNLTSDYSEQNFSYQLTNVVPGLPTEFNIGSTIQSNTVTLEYFNPHLLDSVDYYLASNIIVRNSKFKAKEQPQSTFNPKPSFTSSSSYIGVSVGKRFASYSHAEISTFDSTVSMKYGWDSRDDILFPTQGSKFNVHLLDFISSDPLSIIVDYQSFTSFGENKVFSWGFSDYMSDDGFNNTFEPTVYLGISDIDSSMSRSGQYSGWNYNLTIPTADNANGRIILGAKYTHQTDNLILTFNFSLGGDVL